METWFWILGWILSILTITGNGFIIFLVISNRQLRTKTNAFIVSLAVADFFVGASVVPSLFFCDITSQGCNWLTTRIPDVLRWFFGYTSMMNLCSLVLDRYTAVVKPMKYLTFMTGRRVIQMIFFSWVFAFGFVTAAEVVAIFYKRPDISNILYIIFLELPSCLLLIFCFTSVMHVLYKQDRAAPKLGKQLRVTRHREKSAIVMLAIVVGVFLVCYGIYSRCSLVRIFHKPCNDFKYKIPMLVLNSAVNPWAYAFFKRDIKNEFIRLNCTMTFKKNNKLRPVNKARSFAFTVGNSTM